MAEHNSLGLARRTRGKDQLRQVIVIYRWQPGAIQGLLWQGIDIHQGKREILQRTVLLLGSYQ